MLRTGTACYTYLYMQELLIYFLRITPGLILVSSVFFLIPKKQIVARIFVLILGFVLIRDAMTPEGLWNFGITSPAIWLRFIDDGYVLTTMGALSLLIAFLLLNVKELRRLVRWGELHSAKTYMVGFIAGVAVALPFLLVGMGVPIEDRGGYVGATLLPALLFMALAGNFLEEVIFRGFLQSYLAKQMTGLRAAAVSGVIFAVAHVFLASTVTALGWPLLVFVLIEGLVCAFVYRNFGLVSSTVAHGFAIFILSSGVL